jgi:hypothetical protein
MKKPVAPLKNQHQFAKIVAARAYQEENNGARINVLEVKDYKISDIPGGKRKLTGSVVYQDIKTAKIFPDKSISVTFRVDGNNDIVIG